MINAIKDDNKWDQCTYDRVVQKPKEDGSKPAVLAMDENIRSQFTYWRDLRNSCAHYKDQIIKAAHVLTLYIFIESNLMKISVAGGAQSLLLEFGNYCDYTKHSQNDSLLPLAEKIHEMVPVRDLDSFIPDVLSKIFMSSRCPFNFIKMLLELDGVQHTSVKKSLMGYIHNRQDLKDNFLSRYPEYVPLLLHSNEDVREYLTVGIRYSSNPLKIVSELLQAQRIKDVEQDDLLGNVIRVLFDSNKGYWNLSELDIIAIRKSGYCRIFIDNYLTSKMINEYPGYRDNNYKTDFYISHLKLLEIDSGLVSRFLELFDASRPTPYVLKNRIRDELWNTPNFKDRFLEIANANGISIPPDFLS